MNGGSIGMALTVISQHGNILCIDTCLGQVVLQLIIGNHFNPMPIILVLDLMQQR